MNDTQTASQPRFVRPKATAEGATVDRIFNVVSKPSPSAGDATTKSRKGQRRANVVPAQVDVSGDVVPFDVTTNPALSWMKSPAPWPASMDLTPNVFLRSALFGCAAGKTPLHVDEQVIASTPQYVVKYTGRQLTPFDLMVYALCCASARKAGSMGSMVRISLREMNRAMGKVEGGANNALIIASLKRLYHARVMITQYLGPEAVSADGKRHRPSNDYWTGFIAHAFVDKTDSNQANHKYNVCIAPNMLPLFSSDAVELDVARMGQLGPMLTRWLHSFYSTHSDPIDMPVKELLRLSGTPDMPMSKFREKLKKAVEDLTTCTPPLFAQGCYITKSDRLHIVKATNSRMLGPRNSPDPKPNVTESTHMKRPKGAVRQPALIL